MKKYMIASIVGISLSSFATFTQAGMCQNYSGENYAQCQCNFWQKSDWCKGRTYHAGVCPGGYNIVKGVCTPPPSLPVACRPWTDMYKDCITSAKQSTQCTKKGVVADTCATSICNQNIQSYQAAAKACASKQ